jgi:hypothetical protein
MPPGGSPLTRIFRVLFGAIAHRKAKVPEEAATLHEVDGGMSVIPGQAKMDRWGCTLLVVGVLL